MNFGGLSFDDILDALWFVCWTIKVVGVLGRIIQRHLR